MWKVEVKFLVKEEKMCVKGGSGEAVSIAFRKIAMYILDVSIWNKMRFPGIQYGNSLDDGAQ